MNSNAWLNGSGRASCPDCDGFGYHDDGTDEGEECETCDGNGVATLEAGNRFLVERRERS